MYDITYSLKKKGSNWNYPTIVSTHISSKNWCIFSLLSKNQKLGDIFTKQKMCHESKGHMKINICFHL